MAVHDVSGSESDRDSQPIAVAGLLSTVTRWRRFEREWNAVLGDPQFNVPYLHMKEFTYSAGPYGEGWRGDEEKRAALLTRLTDVVKHNVSKVWVMYVPLDAFRAVNARYMIQEGVGGPYSLGVHLCVDMVDEWLARHKPDEPVAHLVEAGDSGQQAFVEACRDSGRLVTIYPKLNPKTQTWFRPFEAADLVAYEYRTELIRAQVPERTRPARRSLLAISEHVPYELRRATVDGLEAMCRHLPERFPPRI